MKQEPVRVDYIVIQERWRKGISEDTVVRLMESIKSVGGLLHPIAVRYVDGLDIDGEEVDGVPVLVAGRHRLEAVRRLGHARVDCLIFDDEVSAEKWEISENLDRSDLTALERDQHLARWIKLTDIQSERLSGQSVQKVDRLGRTGAHRPESGLSAASRELGVNRKDAERAVSVAAIPDPVVESIRAFGLDDSRMALVQIGKAAQTATKAAVKAGAAPEQVSARAVKAAESKLEEVLDRKTTPKAPVTIEHMAIFQAAFNAMTAEEKHEARQWIALQVIA